MPRSPGWFLPHLEHWRRFKILSTVELAQRSGVDPNALSKLEHQRARAGTKTIDRLCEALKITREQLLYEDPTKANEVKEQR